jgi:hypothetical protein
LEERKKKLEEIKINQDILRKHQHDYQKMLEERHSLAD